MTRRQMNKAKKFHEIRRKKRRLNKQNDGGAERIDYDDTTYKKNSLFEEYYRTQNICKSEEDLQKIVEYMQKDLPATLRVYSNGMYFKIISDYLQSQQEKYSKSPLKLDSTSLQFKDTNDIYHGPKRVSWYPSNIAWKLGTDRLRLRKDAGLKDLHNFLVREAKTENITRQEEVSMIPPLLLEVKPHHRVLDACAAPGSKTAQLLEFLHAGEKTEGFLVANDADPKRAYMLHHQLKRFSSPNLLITCCEAQLFPEVAKFDRILCDVPCSGDGTMRKNVDVMRTWDANAAGSLHPLQLMILWKALKLLSTDGYLVYSTCSLNPIEDEAIVAQALKLSKGAVELVDCSGKLEGLKTRKGVSQWKVGVQVHDPEAAAERESGDGAAATARLQFFENMEEFAAFREKYPLKGGKVKLPKKLYPSMFPDSPEEMKKYNLDRCMRVLPQDQDTGGFFVCLLKKTRDIERWGGSLTEKIEKVSEKEEEITAAPKVKSLVESEMPSPAPKEDEVSKAQFQKIPDRSWNDACDEFGVDEKIKEDLKDQIFFRPSMFKGKKGEKIVETSQPKVLSFVGKSLVETFLKDEIQKRLQIISCGVPILKRSEKAKMKYRITNDGLNIMEGMISKRRLHFTLDDFEQFSRYALYKPVSKESKEGKVYCPGVPLDVLSDGAKEGLTEEVGSFVVNLVEADANRVEAGFGNSLKFSVWKAKSSIAQLIGESDLQVLFTHMKDHGLLKGDLVPDVTLEDYYRQMWQIKENQKKKDTTPEIAAE